MSYDQKTFEGKSVSLDSLSSIIKTGEQGYNADRACHIQGSGDEVPSLGRRRAIEYYLARAALRRVIDGGRKEIDFGPLVPLHRAWIDRYAEGRFVCLKLEDEYIYIRCYNRFQEPYRRALRRRLAPLKRVLFTVKIELTIDSKRARQKPFYSNGFLYFE